MKDNKKTILIVDDTETNIDILLELLGDEYDVMVSLDGKSALEIVNEDDIDLILLDIMMPDMDGYEVCEILKANAKSANIPVIFITAKTDEASIEKAYDVGAVDYITKPFKPRELLARVKTQLKVKELINNLEFIASHDSMTGVYNRRKFFELANEKFKDKADDLYAVMIDIDNFKPINDMYGHPTGDKVIKLVATTIKNNIRAEAIFARLGGEEFVIICNSPSQELIKSHIENIRELIESLEVLSDDKKSIKFTISEGLAKASSDMKSLDELLKKADSALYEAKGSGRNKVVFRD
ncbi:diguanylate cyclase [Candidatus Sulfurimonas baltica]|uniref:diguanylate cyclase n=1 Tax=Candidatus Sulfurimonas baltica TaxID=2740404 RepID=A0A7S7LVR7_9BACT|nr:diguanylate cyclase [Candidatus Sulfurimonas baltica]QOY52404.1 diguanylate cyclase [Candidatus Sulfurimonas baltica]